MNNKTVIELETFIQADMLTCFDLARDVDIHKLSAVRTNEIAVAGRITGLCEAGDTITWEATHFGVRQRLSVIITKLDKPYFFEDTMSKGAFKKMRHEHHFELRGKDTIMRDRFEYELPLGVIGRGFDSLVLKRYMTNFLITRNKTIKEVAENKQAQT